MSLTKEFLKQQANVIKATLVANRKLAPVAKQVLDVANTLSSITEAQIAHMNLTRDTVKSVVNDISALTLSKASQVETLSYIQTYVQTQLSESQNSYALSLANGTYSDLEKFTSTKVNDTLAEIEKQAKDFSETNAAEIVKAIKTQAFDNIARVKSKDIVTQTTTYQEILDTLGKNNPVTNEVNFAFAKKGAPEAVLSLLEVSKALPQLVSAVEEALKEQGAKAAQPILEYISGKMQDSEGPIAPMVSAVKDSILSQYEGINIDEIPSYFIAWSIGAKALPNLVSKATTLDELGQYRDFEFDAAVQAQAKVIHPEWFAQAVEEEAEAGEEVGGTVTIDAQAALYKTTIEQVIDALRQGMTGDQQLTQEEKQSLDNIVSTLSNLAENTALLTFIAQEEREEAFNAILTATQNLAQATSAADTQQRLNDFHTLLTQTIGGLQREADSAAAHQEAQDTAAETATAAEEAQKDAAETATTEEIHVDNPNTVLDTQDVQGQSHQPLDIVGAGTPEATE